VRGRAAPRASAKEPGHLPRVGLGLLLEQVGHRLDRQLRRHLALRMPAHAIGQREQHRLAGVAVAHAVFVLLATALAAELVDGKLHGAHRWVTSEAGRPFLPSGEIRFSNCWRTLSATLGLE